MSIAKRKCLKRYDVSLSNLLDLNSFKQTLSLKEEILKLQRRLTTEKEKASSKEGAAHGHVDAVLFTDIDTRIEMTLTYSTTVLSHHFTTILTISLSFHSCHL